MSRLTLLTQRDWFTVFRYERPGQSPWIIKLDPILDAFLHRRLFLKPSLQAHLREQLDIQVPSPGEGAVQVGVGVSAPPPRSF